MTQAPPAQLPRTAAHFWLVSTCTVATVFVQVWIGVVTEVGAEPGAGHEVAAPAGVSSVQSPGDRLGQTVSLRKILNFADKHSPLIQIAQAEKQFGHAEVVAASPLLPSNPELSLGAGTRAASGARARDFEVSLSQAFDIAGQRGLRIEAAQQSREVSELRLDETRWQVHQSVHAAFHTALVARERAQAAAHVLEFTERLAHVAQRRLAAGDISPLQVRVAEGELAQARQAKVAADSEHLSSRFTLAELAGWPVENPPRAAGNLDEPRRVPEHAELVERARQSSPSLRTQAGVVAEAHARTRLAAREAWPRPTLGVAYALESEPGGGEGARIGMLTLGLPLPLWQRNQGEQARARAHAQLTEARHDAAKRSIVVRVAQARAEVNAGAERIRSYGSEIIPAFERNMKMLERAFELGEVDLLQVMVARGRFLEIERHTLSAYDDYFAAIAALEALVGTEIWPDEEHAETHEESEKK